LELHQISAARIVDDKTTGCHAYFIAEYYQARCYMLFFQVVCRLMCDQHTFMLPNCLVIELMSCWLPC